ncbi:MAG: hypothetical protein IKD81_06830 [Eubacteriaceae bacterium]|nr:hypothetical protein [Eubacteriaceae bacterium]
MEDIIIILTLLGEAALLYAVISFLSARLSQKEKEHKDSKEDDREETKTAKDLKIGRWCLLHGTISIKRRLVQRPQMTGADDSDELDRLRSTKWAG